MFDIKVNEPVEEIVNGQSLPFEELTDEEILDNIKGTIRGGMTPILERIPIKPKGDFQIDPPPIRPVIKEVRK